MLAAHRWTRWFIRRVIEFWPSLHQQEPKGPQSWNQCQTNHVSFKMARQMKVGSKWSWTSGACIQSSATVKASDVHKDLCWITSRKVSLMHKGNLTATELSLGCRKMRQRPKDVFLLFFFPLDVCEKNAAQYWCEPMKNRKVLRCSYVCALHFKKKKKKQKDRNCIE